MMSNVTILCPNARRVQVQVTPLTIFKKVLDDGCLKSGFDPNTHELRTQSGKIVDLSLTWRLSGFPNNVTFEMVPRTVASGNLEVEIVLQHPDGRRATKKVSPTISLLELLVELSPSFGESLVETVDGKVPCVVFMNKTYTGASELSATSLTSLGITTKCLIRYQRRILSPEELAKIAQRVAEEEKKKEELMGKFEELKKANEERERIEQMRQKEFEREQSERNRREQEQAAKLMENCQPPALQQDRLNDFRIPQQDRLTEPPRADSNSWSFDSHTFSRPQQQNSMRLEELNRLLERVDTSLAGRVQNDHIADIVADRGRIRLSEIARTIEHADNSGSMEEVVEFAAPCDRKALVYEKATERVDEPMELGEDFFQVQIEDVKIMQKDLRNQVKQQSQAAFVSKTSVEKKNRASKLKSYEHTVIRVVAGTHVLQLCFNSGEPSSRLIDEVRKNLLSPTEDVRLFCANIRLESDDQKNFVDVSLAPKSTVILRLGTTPKENSFNIAASDFAEASRVSDEWLSKNTTYSPFVATVEERSVFKRPSNSANDGSAVSPHALGPPAKASLPKWMASGRR